MAVEIPKRILDMDVELSSLSPQDLLQLASQQRNVVQELLAEQRRLEERFKLLEAMYFGRKSERRRWDVPGQSTLFGVPITPEEEEAAEEAGQQPDEPTQEAADDQVVASWPEGKSPDNQVAGKSKNGGGRQPVSKELPTVVVQIPVDDALRVGPDGEPLDTIGWEVSTAIHYEPGRCVCLEMRREKLGRRSTGETLERAPIPERIVPGGKLTDPLIIELATAKYYQGIPLARTLIELNAAHCGISSSLASDAVLRLGALLAPVAQEVRDGIFRAPFLHVDETPISYQLGCGPSAQRKQGYFIVVVAEGQCFVEFATSRAGYQIARALQLPPEACANRDPPDADDPGDGRQPRAAGDPDEPETRPYIGYLVVDGYAGYNGVVGPGKAVRVACNVHALRYFKRAARTNTVAQAIVAAYQRIFAVEREARRFIARHKLQRAEAAAHYAAERDRHSRGLWQALRRQVEQAASTCDPASALGRACAYFFNRYADLTVYLDHGILPMDNNAAERSIRPITVGRKNYQFVGSIDAGNNAATLYTLMESCRLIGLDPWGYLTWLVGTIHQAHANGHTPDYAASTPKASKATVRAWIKAQRQLPSDQRAQPFLGI